MKAAERSFITALCIFAGCVAAPERWTVVSREKIVAQLQTQSFTAEQLGIDLVGEPGSQTIRWREVIRPNDPVTIPLLPNAGAATQPRVSLILNGGTAVPVSIDSGAALNLYDAPLALRNGVKVADPKTFGNVFQGLGGQEFSYYGMFDSVSLGALHFQNLFAILRVPTPGTREQVDNLMGLATLAKFSYVTLDFPQHEVTFALHGQYSAARPVLAQTSLSLQALQLVVDVQVNGKFEASVVLDTGNDAALMLTEEMVEAMELTKQASAGRKGRFLGVGGVIETRTFDIDSIGIGGRNFTAVEATVVPNSFPPSLGSGFLRQFRATIDFKARKLWLE